MGGKIKVEINYFMIGLLIFITWAAVYTVIHRICQCIENKEMYHAFSIWLTKSDISNTDEFSKIFRH